MSQPQAAKDLAELPLKIFTARPGILARVRFLIVVAETEAPAARPQKMNRDR